MPWIALGLVGLLLPLLDDSYIGVIAQRAYIYWILSAGLESRGGLAGQIAIGWVAMLTLGAYTTAALTAGTATPAWHPYLALIAGGVVGALFGVIVGLPALRLRTFYFAMTTLGFATIVTQVALAWKNVTGGGIGTPGPGVSLARSIPAGASTISALILAALAHLDDGQPRSSRFGRALVAIRDAEVAAEASGVAKPATPGRGVPVQRRPGRRGGRAVRLAAVLHHARRLYLRDVGAVLHRHPDRRAWLDPGAAARYHRPDGAARVRGAAGGRGRRFSMPRCC